MENFEQELKNIASPNYEKLSDVNSIYSDLVNKITQVINKHAPCKTIRVKNQSNKCFDKLLKKFKKSKLHINELIYKKVKNIVQRLIKAKKKLFSRKSWKKI